MKVYQQGEADGLCGLYALLNFLNRTDWRGETVAKGLWYLFDACRSLGWLTPQYLIEGFEEHQLKAILDLQFVNYRMNFETYFVADVAMASKVKKFTDLASKVVKKGGSIIASWEKRQHWVLVTGEQGRVVVLDSSSKIPAKALSKNQRALDLEFGLSILPKHRSPIAVDL